MTKWHYILDIGPYPIKAYYTPTKKSWHRLLKKLGLTDEPYPIDDSAGKCCIYKNPKNGDPICIIVIAPPGDHELHSMLGVIAHECMHVWQEVRARIGEEFPSIEFEAYTIQSLVASVTYAWFKHVWNKK